MSCHLSEGAGADTFEGPDMSGYASRSWIFGQIRNPEAITQYGELNQMPAFPDELDDHDIKMLAGFLRQQRFEKPKHPVGSFPEEEQVKAAAGDE